MKPITIKKDSILIIDDSVDLLDVQKLILEAEGYSVFTAMNVKTALDVLSDNFSPDLILLDYRLDGYTGNEFLEILDEERPEILEKTPFVFYSGVDKISNSHAVGFISKICGMNQYLSEVRYFVNQGQSLLK